MLCRTRLLIFSAAAVFAVFLQPCCTTSSSRLASAQASAPPSSDWPEDNLKHASVSLREFRPGGPGKDGIPSLTLPRLVPAPLPSQAFSPGEPLIVYRDGKVARAYPLSLLMWHEIVNDTVNGHSIAVTFCPLCNAAIIFDRRVDERVLEFGVSGLLRNSDMIMYDRQTQSWWQQFTGECLAGKLAGRKLQIVPSEVVSYLDFRKAYPAGQILSTDTGYHRAYGTNPYEGYDQSAKPFLYDGPIDPRLPAMERVLGVISGTDARAYPYTLLEKYAVINDNIGGKPIVVISGARTLSILDQALISKSKNVLAPRIFQARVGNRNLTFGFQRDKMTDHQTGSTWNVSGSCEAGPLRGSVLSPVPAAFSSFAFAWFAFHPESTVYSPNKKLKPQ